MLKSFKELIVWQRSIELVEEIYDASRELPKDEVYNLVSQMRRSAVSIPSNIAEGYKRSGMGEYLRFLNIADASAAELETQIIISEKLYSKTDFQRSKELLEEVQKMLVTLIKKLKPLNHKTSVTKP